MRRPIPSTRALTAFEAAARHGNFTRAAEEISLTEGAISRQIALLEEQLGLALFTRVKRRVVLTPAGEAYAARVRDILGRIERETLSLMAHGGGEGSLELAVLPTFASEWLIPRMGRFLQRHPHVSVSMGVRTRMFMFEETAFDAAIHFGQPTWPGTGADPLFGESLVPVCRPGLVPHGARAETLLGLPLVHSATRPDDWARWFAHAGVEGAQAQAMGGARFELHSMAISAARAGHGIALMPRFLLQGALDDGSLVIAVDLPLPSQDAYYLVYPENRQASSRLHAFRRWLIDEAGRFAHDNELPTP
ncbi:MAG: LysR family transcriptional regulator [Burkholderiales bacterium]|jgi:DNA-binding transcriptional LysR family regulator|nr:LysR family transcriptional regulator [Burkholderiales bacterium]